MGYALHWFIALVNLGFALSVGSMLNGISGGVLAGVLLAAWAWDIDPETANLRWNRRKMRPEPSEQDG